jgi:hypothetical protein
MADDRLLAGFLADPDTGWSMGTVGAVAEFVRGRDEPVTSGDGTVLTRRGGIRLAPPDGLRLRAYETPAGPHDHWNHALALCLPAVAARAAGRTVVTDLGPDGAALDPAHRDDVLFDLGLGTPTVDVQVRTGDPDLLTALRAAIGRPFLESEALAAVLRAGPHRVFGTVCGRVEVYAPIPAPDGRSPDGPHTHLLPHLLREGRTHAATVPVPPGHLPVAHCYPPHPLADQAGRPIPFDPERHRAFQALLESHGDPGLALLKSVVLEAGSAPDGGTPPERAVVAVALRQLAQLGRGPAPEVDPALLDPAGDRNGG